jgi:hypothetical protein
MEDIYLIHTLECYKLKEELYKIGTSHDSDTRIRQYAKGYKILSLMSCEKSIQCEKELIVLFKNHFNKSKE